MRPNTPKGKIGKRRVYLNEKEIAKESPDGVHIYRRPIWGSQLVSGHWYADVYYDVGKSSLSKAYLYGSGRWRYPVFIHFAGYGSAVDDVTGEEIVVSLFNEIVNDAGVDYTLTRFGELFSIGGIGQDTPLFQPTEYEVEKVKRRASEKRHGWSE